VSKRLLDAQSGADAKTLLGHVTAAMPLLYGKSRDQTPIEVKIASKG
jgi:hypothetical protein